MPLPSTLPGIALVGCGHTGQKRAAALHSSQLLHASDTNLLAAQRLAAQYPLCTASANLEPILTDPRVSLVIVGTPHVALAPITLQCLRAGKHVLVEKPGAISSTELSAVLALANSKHLHVHVGYNQRFHPALQKARQLVDTGALGPLMSLRARYGHGGRLGYNTEWRANPAISGGGELIDQGVHLIDLASWFLGPFCIVDGHAVTSFWDMPVDDNAYLSLRTGNNQTAWLHASCTEWKNTFSFELYGKQGKIAIDGLGGSYGTERLAFYKMLPEMGPPETTLWEYPQPDTSWARELHAFEESLQTPFDGNPNLSQAILTLQIVETIYSKSRNNGPNPTSLP